MARMKHEAVNKMVKRAKVRKVSRRVLPGTPPSVNTPGSGMAFKELSHQSCLVAKVGHSGAVLLGEWMGQERNADRSARTDPFIAMAQFIYGTITPGCGCEECYSRRQTVMTLIYTHDLDMEAFNQGIFPTPPTEPGS